MCDAVDLYDLDRIDRFERLCGFANNFGENLEQGHFRLQGYLVRRQDIGGFVDCALTGGLHFKTNASGFCTQLFGFRLALGRHADSFGAVRGRFSFGFGFDLHADRLTFGLF